MKYKLEVNGVENTETGTIIPNDERNPDWILYQDWLAEGNTPDLEFTDDEIEAKRVAEIKDTAGVKIVEMMPEWKQRNSIARMLEIVTGAVDLTALSADDLAEISAAMLQWDDVNAIRDTSNTAEVDGTNPDDIVW